MKERYYCLLILVFLLFPMICLASSHYGTTLSYVVITKEPSPLRGYQLLFTYDPDQFKWKQWNIYFDGGFAHLWIPQTSPSPSINIYTISPIVRYTLLQRKQFSPYLDFSIGLAYLSQTRLGARNLGIHFAFQDRLGLGALIGASQQFSIGIHAAHYSNAHLSSHNSGITIPLMLDVAYRFQ